MRVSALAIAVPQQASYDRGMKLSELVRTERERRGWSAKKLALQAGVDPAAISRIEHGKQIGHGTTLAGIARALEIDPTLMQGVVSGDDDVRLPADRDPRDIASELLASLGRQRKVLRLTVTLQPGSAGYGDVPEAETIDFVPEPGTEDHDFLPVPISGECMEPDLPAGHIAVVDRTLPVQDGDLVLASHEGEYVFKRLEQRGEEHWLVANQIRPPIMANGETLILGVVVASQKSIRRRRRP